MARQSNVPCATVARMERSVIRERPVRLAMPVPDYATEGGRSIRATLPSRTRRKSATIHRPIRDHIDASTRGPEHVVTNSKNLFHPAKWRERMVAFTVNGVRRELGVDPNTPLLWVLREHLKLTGPKFGCGIAS